MADEAKTTTINIDSASETALRFSKEVPLAVNGQIARVPIGQDVEVGEHVVDALTNAGIAFTVVTPKGETGSSAEGVSVGEPIISGTPAGAPSGEDPHPAEQRGEDALTKPTELSNDTPKGEVEISGKMPVGTNEDGNVVLADTTVTAAGTGGGEQGGETSADETSTETDQTDDETGVLDGTIADISTSIKDISDVAEIDKLIAAETAGKSRAGALSALEARKTELAAS